MHKNFYSSHWILKHQIFSLFPIVKLNANYAEIYRVSNLVADFQQVPLVQFFSEIFTILLWNINNLNSAKKRKNIFLHKNSKNHFTIEIAQVRLIFGRKFICRVIIWE